MTTNSEQHGDRADINDDQDHRQELGALQDEQAGGVEEGQDQEQHRMDRVARGDHHYAGGHDGEREDIEGQGLDDHRSHPYCIALVTRYLIS